VRTLTLIALVIATSLQTVSLGASDSPRFVTRTAAAEVAAGTKKCPFLTRWSEQWRKCVLRWPTLSGV
jgi:hypothetical protein